MGDISFISRLRNAWDVFRNKDPTTPGPSYGSYNIGKRKLSYGVDRTIVASLYNRMAMDVSTFRFRHVRLDENGNFSDTIDDELNKCLNLFANINQTSRSLIQDIVLSMFDDGAAAIVATKTSADPRFTDSYEVLELQVGKIVEWFPYNVRVSLFNNDKGDREEVIIPKKTVAIAHNPLYAVMNERNSVLQRLTRKLALLDQADERAGSGKLDLLIQFPYETNTQRKQEYADARLKQIEEQVTGSRLGIAYIGGTEHVIQLNRPAENNLLEQIKYHTELLYNQLGITEEVFAGTADEQVMLNYYNRTIEPIVSEICLAMTRTFLSKTARTQGQAVMYFREPFKLVPVSNLAEIADKFTRNEILTSNEVRAIIGLEPSDDPKADELRNKNLNDPNAGQDPMMGEMPMEESMAEPMFFKEELER